MAPDPKPKQQVKQIPGDKAPQAVAKSPEDLKAAQEAAVEKVGETGQAERDAFRATLPKKSTTDKKAVLAEDTADDLTTPSEKTATKEVAKKKPSKYAKLDKQIAQLPEGKMKEACRAILKQLIEDPGSSGILSEGMLALLIIAAKTQKYLDVIPGNYVKRINKIEKNMSDEEIAALMEMRRQEESEPKTEEIKEYGSDADIDSTRYVCDVLWNSKIKAENSDDLAAKLLNAQRESENPYYVPATSLELKNKGMPYGTIIVLRVSMKNPVNILAFATGKKDECKYFDAKEKKVKKFSLKNTPFKIISGLVPKINTDSNYFDTPAESGKKKFELDEKLKKDTSKLKKAEE